MPCPEVVAVFYIRPAEVPTLLSVEGDAQVEQQNTVVGFLTLEHLGLDLGTLKESGAAWLCSVLPQRPSAGYGTPPRLSFRFVSTCSFDLWNYNLDNDGMCGDD